MPIDTTCPHCSKAYKLKDELAGKRVTCGNPNCRQPFNVPAAKEPVAAKAAPRPDADAVAAAAFADDPDTAPQVVHMTCSMCEHKWDEPWEKQGKNVLCPECRHRQKVPVQKKEEWRGGNKPSLAKQDKLEGAVGTVDQKFVSGEALKKAGVIVENIEPRPTWHYFAAAGGVAALLLAVVFGVQAIRGNRDAGKQSRYMAEAVQELADSKDALPESEMALFRAAGQVAAGEFDARQNDPAKLKAAIEHFAKARKELAAAASGTGRTLLVGELAAAQVGLGGPKDDVLAGTRLRWTPAGAGTAKAKINEKTFTVAEEQADTMGVLQQPDRTPPVLERQLAARRLARALAAAGQAELLANALKPAFSDAELPEALALAGLEVVAASGVEAAKPVTAAVRERVGFAGTGATPAVQALCQADDPEDKTVPFAKPPSGPGPVSDAPRLAFAMLYAAQKKPAEAVELARQGPTPDNRGTRATALAAVAELSDDPAPAVQAAADIVSNEAKPKDVGVPELVLIRLARQAARAKQPDKADLFAKAIEKPDARAWARLEAVRAAQSTDEAAADVPADPKDYKVGHALARLAVARQAARDTGDTSVSLRYDGWGRGTLRPFGFAGLALGLQDRALK
ncbi:MAG: hypothetical protein U0871_10675 [Gemmataceae bacterium]